MGKNRRIKINIQKRARKFWEWFKKNERDIFDFKNNQEMIFKSLSEKLYSVHPSLGFAFHEQIQEENKRKIILSPNGDKAAIPFLNILYEEMPELERLQVTLYKPRIPISDCLKPIEVKDIIFDPNRAKFVLFAKDTLIYIIFFVEDYEDKQKKETIQTCVILLIDQLIGEYNAMTKIGDIMIQPEDTPFEKGKKYPLKYLPLAFDETTKKIEKIKQTRNHD